MDIICSGKEDEKEQLEFYIGILDIVQKAIDEDDAVEAEKVGSIFDLLSLSFDSPVGSPIPCSVEDYLLKWKKELKLNFPLMYEEHGVLTYMIENSKTRLFVYLYGRLMRTLSTGLIVFPDMVESDSVCFVKYALTYNIPDVLKVVLLHWPSIFKKFTVHRPGEDQRQSHLYNSVYYLVLRSQYTKSLKTWEIGPHENPRDLDPILSLLIKETDYSWEIKLNPPLLSRDIRAENAIQKVYKNGSVSEYIRLLENRHHCIPLLAEKVPEPIACMICAYVYEGNEVVILRTNRIRNLVRFAIVKVFYDRTELYRGE